MTGLRARIAKLVAILLIVQAMVAPSLCLAHAAAMLAASNGAPASRSAAWKGWRSIQVGDDGQKQSPDLAAQGGFGLVCHAAAAGTDATRADTGTAGWVMVAIAASMRSLASLRPAIRGPPLGAQAPPQLS